jgi:hypothetical protein
MHASPSAALGAPEPRPAAAARRPPRTWWWRIGPVADAADLAAFVSHQVSTAVYQFRATITVQASVAQVTERIPPTVGVVEPIDSASCRLTLGANHMDSLILQLGLLDFEFQVEDPPELAERLRVLADRLRRAG